MTSFFGSLLSCTTLKFPLMLLCSFIPSCQKVPLLCCLFGHHPAPHARSSKSSLSNYSVLLTLSPFSVVHALTYKNTKISGLGEIIHWDLVFFSILFSIILKFRHSFLSHARSVVFKQFYFSLYSVVYCLQRKYWEVKRKAATIILQLPGSPSSIYFLKNNFSEV